MKQKSFEAIHKIKEALRQWNIFEKVWLVVFVLIGILLSIVWESTLFQGFVFLTSILCLVLTAKGRLSAFVFGVFNSLGHGYLAFSNHLYGEMVLYLLFFFPTGILGFILWHRNIKKNHGLIMRKLSKKWMGIICILIFVLIWAIGFATSAIRAQYILYVYASTNVLSVVATLLTINRFREQWLLYIVLNLANILMWSIRLYHGNPDGLLMVIMWTAYLINALYGYYNWNQGVKEIKA